MVDLDKGMRARVRPTIIAGEITRRRFDEESGEKELLLAWTVDGEAHERWFKPSELEPDPDAASAA